MSGKGRISAVLILAIAAFAGAGCVSPVMSLGGLSGSGSGAAGRLEVVQTPRSYTVGEVFELNENHLRVFTVSGGTKKEVFPLDDNDCEVWVIDPTEESIRVRAEGLMFSTSGRKTIRVWYKNLAPQEYPITVQPETQVEMGAIGWEWA